MFMTVVLRENNGLVRIPLSGSRPRGGAPRPVLGLWAPRRAARGGRSQDPGGDRAHRPGFRGGPRGHLRKDLRAEGGLRLRGGGHQHRRDRPVRALLHEPRRAYPVRHVRVLELRLRPGREPAFLPDVALRPLQPGAYSACARPRGRPPEPFARPYPVREGSSLGASLRPPAHALLQDAARARRGLGPVRVLELPDAFGPALLLGEPLSHAHARRALLRAVPGETVRAQFPVRDGLCGRGASVVGLHRVDGAPVLRGLPAAEDALQARGPRRARLLPDAGAHVPARGLRRAAERRAARAVRALPHAGDGPHLERRHDGAKDRFSPGLRQR